MALAGATLRRPALTMAWARTVGVGASPAASLVLESGLTDQGHAGCFDVILRVPISLAFSVDAVH